MRKERMSNKGVEHWYGSPLSGIHKLHTEVDKVWMRAEGMNKETSEESLGGKLTEVLAP